MKKIKGFTLVELLVVMAVMSILMVIVIYGVKAIRIRGRDAQRKSDINKVRVALETYKTDAKVYPLPVVDLTIPDFPGYFNGENSGFSGMVGKLVTDKYLDGIVTDPQESTGSGFKYRYRVSNEGLSFQLSAKTERETTGCGGRYAIGKEDSVDMGGCTTAVCTCDANEYYWEWRYNTSKTCGTGSGSDGIGCKME